MEYEFAEKEKGMAKRLFKFVNGWDRQDHDKAIAIIQNLVLDIMFKNKMLQHCEEKMQTIMTAKEYKEFAEEEQRQSMMYYLECLQGMGNKDDKARVLVLDEKTGEMEVVSIDETRTTDHTADEETENIF